MQELPALGGGGQGGVGVAHSVDHDEVVNNALVSDGGDRHAGLAELGGVGLASSRSGSASPTMIIAGGSPARSSRLARRGEAVICARAAGSVVYWSQYHCIPWRVSQ